MRDIWDWLFAGFAICAIAGMLVYMTAFLCAEFGWWGLAWPLAGPVMVGVGYLVVGGGE